MRELPGWQRAVASEKGATAPADVSVDEVIESRKRTRGKMKLGYEYEGQRGRQPCSPSSKPAGRISSITDQTSEAGALARLGALVPGGFLTIAGALVMILEDPGSGLAFAFTWSGHWMLSALISNS